MIHVGSQTLGDVGCMLDAGHDEDRWRDPWTGRILNADEYAEHNRAGGDALLGIEPTPHRITLEWEDAPIEVPWVDDGGPDFDTEVPVDGRVGRYPDGSPIWHTPDGDGNRFGGESWADRLDPR
jgi:hypothetical protein